MGQEDQQSFILMTKSEFSIERSRAQFWRKVHLIVLVALKGATTKIRCKHHHKEQKYNSTQKKRTPKSEPGISSPSPICASFWSIRRTCVYIIQLYCKHIKASKMLYLVSNTCLTFFFMQNILEYVLMTYICYYVASQLAKELFNLEEPSYGTLFYRLLNLKLLLNLLSVNYISNFLVSLISPRNVFLIELLLILQSN